MMNLPGLRFPFKISVDDVRIACLLVSVLCLLLSVWCVIFHGVSWAFTSNVRSAYLMELSTKASGILLVANVFLVWAYRAQILPAAKAG